MERKALVVGVEGKRKPLGEGPDLPWARLDYARTCAQSVSDVLDKEYAYTIVTPDPDPAITADALNSALRSATGRGQVDAFTIIHLLSHGAEAKNQHGDLRVVGGDHELTEALSYWVGRMENDPGPTCLLILDLCHAGAAVQQHLHSLVRPESRRAWVLGACHPEESAYNGRLSIAVAEVLAGFASGTLALDESLEHIPLERFCREVADHVARQEAPGGSIQHVERPLAALGEDLSHLAFFPNPRFDPGSRLRRGLVDPALFTLLDEAADIRHFTSRAQGGNSADGDSGALSFTGRGEQLRALTAWLEGSGPAVTMVTGRAGVGKSTLLSILACAAHPRLREHTEALWSSSGEDLPPAVDGLAVVHARRRTLTEITASLAAQWNLVPAEPDAPWTTDRLTAALRSLDRPPVLLVDALDEAEHPAGLIAALFLPLVTTLRADSRPVCRLLIAARPEEYLERLSQAAASGGGTVVDLDQVPREQLRKDITTFVRRLLRPVGPDAVPWCPLPIAEGVAEAVAQALYEQPPECGEYLVALLYAQSLRWTPTPPSDREAAAALGRRVPRSLGAVLDLDLAMRQQDGLAQLLAALAWTEGEGMPERLLALVAGLPPSVSDIGALLRTVGFYLRRSIDRDGMPLYRLFHQGLADELRRRPDLDASTVWQRLLGAVRPDPSRPGLWATANPYLLRHAGRHAARAGELDALLSDPEFLVHADPAPLAEELYRSAPTATGIVYQTSYSTHHSGDPEQRRHVLALDAVRHQEYGLAADLSRDQSWNVAWTAGRNLPTGLRGTLTGHQKAVWCVAVIEVAGRPHAVTGSEDGTTRLWDLDALTTTHLLVGDGRPIWCVVALTVAGQPLAVTGDNAGSLRGWDLAAGRLIWTCEAHQGPVESMTVIRRGSHEVVATAGRDRVVRYWDPASGATVGSTQIQAINGWVTSLSAYPPPQEGVLAFYDGNVWGLDPTKQSENSGELLGAELQATTSAAVLLDGAVAAVVGDAHGSVWLDNEEIGYQQADRITSLTPLVVGDSLSVVSTSDDGTAFLVRPSGDNRQVAGHTTAITSAAVLRSSTSETLLTAGVGGSIRIWDMDSPVHEQYLPGHSHAIETILTLPEGRLATAGLDGTVALWTPAERSRVQLGLYHEGDYAVPDTPTDIALVSAGAHPVLAVSCTLDPVVLWDTAAPQDEDHPPRDWNGDESSHAVGAVVINGIPHLISGGNGEDVTLFAAECVLETRGDRAADRVLFPDSGHEVTCLAVARSADHVLAGDKSGAVRQADLRAVGDPRTVLQHTAAVHAVAAVTVDGRPYAASAHDDGQVILTDLSSGANRPLPGHTRAVFALAPVLMHGRPHLLSGGLDRTVRLWDLGSGSQVDLRWFNDTVFAIAVAEDGAVYVADGPDLVRLEPDPERLPLVPYPLNVPGDTAL